MSITACYITGKPVGGTDSYYFGTPAHVLLRLTQSAFAHFVIRADKDAMHQQIMGDIKQCVDDIDDFQKKHGGLKPDNTDTYIDKAIDIAILADKLQSRLENLMTQKCESGVRILRAIKRDFQATGKLS